MEDKTREETIDYFRCMTITQNVSPLIYNNITKDILDRIIEYINAPMTATWFSENKKLPANRKVVTSEIIYYWMIVQNIPFECQKWHLTRLLTLLRVCNAENSPSKKMSRKESISTRRALNAARRNQFNTKG